MKALPTLKIAKELQALPTVRIGDIEELQGNLKDLSEVDYKKLLQRISKVGFKYPLYIWFDQNKTPHTLDGKQRHRVIEKEFGSDVCLPYIEVFAKDSKEAKMEILAISSDYGKVTKDGFDEFTAEWAEVDFSQLKAETTFDTWLDFEPVPEPEPDKPKTSFNVVVICENEEQQSEVFLKLADMGYNCKI